MRASSRLETKQHMSNCLRYCVKPKKGFFTTGQHEGFHGLLDALVQRDPTASARLGKALLKEIRAAAN